MHALVVYESMYGNTHLIAEAIAHGLTDAGNDVAAIPVQRATPERLAEAQLLVIGGPTHGHSMSRESTREAAVADAEKPDSGLHLDPDAEGEGLRDWFDGLPRVVSMDAAAFDTRFHMAAALTGRASKGISKRLRRHGFHEIAGPESFFVQKGNTLESGEEQRAVAWGRELAALVGGPAAGPVDAEPGGRTVS